MESEHGSTRKGVYRQVADEIIKAIEGGIEGEYQMPWHRNTALGLPRNAVTGRPYRGFNTLALWAASQVRGYSIPAWATYRQWRTIGRQVRRGEKAATIVFYKELEATDDGGGEPVTASEKRRVVARASYVFNAAQVDGWEGPEPHLGDCACHLEDVEHFVSLLGARIRYGGDAAYYTRTDDFIQMPMRSSFVGTATSTATESFYSVLLHEHVHWTGHPSRLDRDLSGRFGNSSYAMEELVAELGAAFLCADLKINDEPRHDHALYVRSWLQVLRDRPAALGDAVTTAMKACQYLGELTEARLDGD
jgi:antirestriction protein ArdC